LLGGVRSASPLTVNPLLATLDDNLIACERERDTASDLR